MGRMKLGCMWLLSLAAVMWAGVSLLRSHFASLRQERDETHARNVALDRSFNSRNPNPLQVRVMMSTGKGSYQVPADLPSFQKAISSLGRLPAIIILPGCEFAIWGKDVPMNVAVLSVGEGPDLLGKKTLGEGCSARDRVSIEEASERSLAFAADYVSRSTWVNSNRVMIVGYGEAAPVVAAYSGPVKKRLTVGDPCLVQWKKFSTKSPILMLFTSEHQGLMHEDKPQQAPDIAAIARGAGPTLPSVKRCVGLARPDISPPARLIVAAGELGIFKKPQALSDAQKAAYEAL